MAYNHFRLKDLYRRRYVFTKTKAFFAFIISAMISVLLSAFYEAHGEKLFQQLVALYDKSKTEIVGAAKALPKNVKPQPADLRRKLLELQTVNNGTGLPNGTDPNTEEKASEPR